MTTIFKRVGALALASAALCAAGTAHADVFSFNWAYRWASGQIRHDASVADSDPSAARDVYADSILDFSLSGLNVDTFTFPQLHGAGGTIVVDNALPGSGGVDTITFLFGAAVPGDSARYRLVASFDPEFQSDSHEIDRPWVSGPFGTVYRGESQEFMVAMNPAYATRHEWVAPSVPEPATWALFGMGLVGLAAGRRLNQAGRSTVAHGA